MRSCLFLKLIRLCLLLYFERMRRMKKLIDRELLLQRMQDKVFRRAFFEPRFYEYCNYYFREYFSFPTPPCLRAIYTALEQ
mgnify:FL=1